MNMREKLSRAAKNIFSSPDGELLLQHLADFSFADKETFVEASERLSSYYAGRRSVILHIRTLLTKETQ